MKVRHLENKLGIHGSPTCELVFDNTPCRLIGERQRGLITYVMALMNGARVGIAAQSLGVAEAAYRLARTYAHTRQQFGGPIERLPAVAEMVTDMKIEIEAARALAYETARVCDLENNNLRVLELGPPLEKEEAEAPQAALPLVEAAQRHAHADEQVLLLGNVQSAWPTRPIQVLGGSGYMKDYAAERYLRDARITTIYEGTSQLQVVAAVRGVTSGGLDTWCEDHEKKTYDDPLLDELKQKLIAARQRVAECVQFVKSKGNAYLDLSGRRLVDSAITIIIGHLLLAQGAKSERKKRVARRFIDREIARAADELRADPRRRHLAAGRVRPAGRPGARGRLGRMKEQVIEFGWHALKGRGGHRATVFAPTTPLQGVPPRGKFTKLFFHGPLVPRKAADFRFIPFALSASSGWVLTLCAAHAYTDCAEFFGDRVGARIPRNTIRAGYGHYHRKC